jgi:hypothetical protein
MLRRRKLRQRNLADAILRGAQEAGGATAAEDKTGTLVRGHTAKLLRGKRNGQPKGSVLSSIDLTVICTCLRLLWEAGLPMQNTVPWRSLTGVVQRFAGAASCSGDGLACQGLQHIRSLDQQLLDAGPCSTSQSCQGWPSLLAHSSLHTSSMQRAQSATSATGTQEDSEEVERKPRVWCPIICQMAAFRPGHLQLKACELFIAENILCVNEHEAPASKANRYPLSHLFPRHHIAGWYTSRKCMAMSSCPRLATAVGLQMTLIGLEYVAMHFLSDDAPAG